MLSREPGKRFKLCRSTRFDFSKTSADCVKFTKRFEGSLLLTLMSLTSAAAYSQFLLRYNMEQWGANREHWEPIGNALRSIEKH